VCRN